MAKSIGGMQTSKYIDQTVVQLACLRRLYHHVTHAGRWDYVIDNHRLHAAIATIERQQDEIERLEGEVDALKSALAPTASITALNKEQTPDKRALMLSERALGHAKHKIERLEVQNAKLTNCMHRVEDAVKAFALNKEQS